MIEKGYVMSTNTSADRKIILNRRMLAIGLIVILSAIVTTGFVWIQTDHVIAPPGLRIMDWLWRVFVH
jgi:uncharacterized membrane protein YbjE (DUF340 family)